MTYANPTILWALFLVPLVLVFLGWAERSRKAAIQQLCYNTLTRETGMVKKRSVIAGFVTGGIILALGLALIFSKDWVWSLFESFYSMLGIQGNRTWNEDHSLCAGKIHFIRRGQACNKDNIRFALCQADIGAMRSAVHQ